MAAFIVEVSLKRIAVFGLFIGLATAAGLSLVGRLPQQTLFGGQAPTQALEPDSTGASRLTSIIDQSARPNAPQFGLRDGATRTPVPRTSKFAEFRELPYPFHSYLTFANDADQTSWLRFSAIHGFLDEVAGLDISDSLFVSNWRSNSDRPVEAETVRIDGIESKLKLELLNWYQRGWFDTLHSWGNPSSYISKESTVELSVKGDQQVERILPLFWGDGRWRDEDYEKIVSKLIMNDPHVLGFAYQLPNSGSFQVGLLNEDGKEIWSTDWIGQGAVGPRPFYNEIPMEIARLFIGKITSLVFRLKGGAAQLRRNFGHMG